MYKKVKLPYLRDLTIMSMEPSYPTEVSKLPCLHRQSHPGTLRSIASHSVGSLVFIGAHASAQKGQMSEEWWPEHDIEHGQV